MCGIYGILTWDKRAALARGVLKKMGDVTLHRGPDDEGIYSDDEILLGMRRLAIIDLDGGHQPLSNENNTIWLVCNGEIYNFKELRESLIRLGHHFSTGSDSEVILHLYEEYGDSFVTHLDGMYGFALWDSKKKRCLIGRDRIGIKPLYYFVDGEKFIFASESKAILSVPGVDAQLDPAALNEFLALGYVSAPHSILRGIKKLPPASLLIYEKGHYNVTRYWRLPTHIDETVHEKEWEDALISQLESAVVSQMVSDVPLGAFLSGGIDSSCVVAFMAKHSDQQVRTYSIGFQGSTGGHYYNELPFARQVSKQFNTDHKEIVVNPDVARLLPRLMWQMDEPLADVAFITTYLVAEFARKDVKVILSGVGGDELFGGYRRYLSEYYSKYYNFLPAWLRRRVIVPFARVLPSDRHSKYMNLSRYMRSFILANEFSFEERYRFYVQVFNSNQRKEMMEKFHIDGTDSLNKAFLEANKEDALRCLFEVDLNTQLPDDLLLLTDKVTMAASLECRVPLLDQGLVELAARVPSRYKVRGRKLKYIFKKALAQTLPENILHRQKRGFGAPMGAWLKNELAPMLQFILSKESVERRGLFRWEFIENTIAKHRANKEDYTDHLLSLINLELWCRMYLDGQTPDDITEQIKRESVH
jgi:asparagine synthase (glutamine-hydrolysing)